MSTTGMGATGGALWGGLIGLLSLAPLFGMAIGAASGAAAGRLTDAGVNDQFMKVLERLRPYGGHVIQTSLDDEQEQRLRTALGEGAAV
jgi:uncharacterized membrane protein